MTKYHVFHVYLKVHKCISWQRQIKEAQRSKSKFKAMLIDFFDIKEIILENREPDGVTVSRNYYKKRFLKHWQQGIRRN